MRGERWGTASFQHERPGPVVSARLSRHGTVSETVLQR
jgi:hypothetical protein